jgi:D-glycero-alpha-D-manno-heptose-7-phosphate kinase
VNKKKLADEAIYLERTLCNEAGGIQDQIAVAFGGFNRINFNADGYSVQPVIISPERKQQLCDNLMLFFTGFSRISAHIQEKTQSAAHDKLSRLLEIKRLVDEAQEILTSTRDLNDFGKLLDYAWSLKRDITPEISTDLIDNYYTKGISAGALGGKLLGAGGGGFLLFYVEKEKQARVKEALANLLHVPFCFENQGTRVIHYAPEDFVQVGSNEVITW